MNGGLFKPQLHCESGHLNVWVRDHDSVVTGFGRHARVVCFEPDGELAECRVDYHHEGLRKPTDKEIIAVMRMETSLSGKWKVHVRRLWGKATNEREDVYLRKI